jgi:preprotein translocase subunit SecA
MVAETRSLVAGAGLEDRSWRRHVANTQTRQEQAVGFWDWLKGKPKSVEEVDVVWMNQDAKFQALCTEVQEQLLATPTVLVVAHFPATLARLRKIFDQNALSHVVQEHRLLAPDFLRAATQGNAPRIMLVRADALIPDEFPNPPADDLTPLSILVAERHFLRANDDPIVAFARSLGRRCRVSFYLSLQDPLLEGILGEWLSGVLTRLGTSESQPIGSKMVFRRFKDGQANFARRVANERKANSAEEWLAANVSE